MPLSDAACRSAKPSEKIRKLSDSGGLQLCVMPNGSKLWWVAYRFGGKTKSLSLGKYPTVSLADARLGRDQAKKLLAKGEDPSKAKRQAKAEQAATGNTFRVVAEEYVTHQRQNERSGTLLENRLQKALVLKEKQQNWATDISNILESLDYPLF